MKFGFRCDASKSIGMGHLMRCIALAQAARSRGCGVHFFTHPSDIARTVLEDQGFAFSEIDRRSVEFLDAVNPADMILVVDGYEMRTVGNAAAARGVLTAQYDDHGSGKYPTRFVVNQNLLQVHEIEVPHGELLIGPTYAAIREEIRRFRSRSTPEVASRLLILTGSADLKHLTGRLCELAVDHGGFQEIIAVVGPSAFDADIPPSVLLLKAPSNMGEIMASASAALSAAGTTTWELMCLGVPTALIQTSDDQVHVAVPLAAAGAALHLSNPQSREEVSGVLSSLARPGLASTLSTRARDLVDGLGAGRVVDRLISAHDDLEFTLLDRRR